MEERAKKKKLNAVKFQSKIFNVFFLLPHLRSNNHLLKTKVEARCEFCILVLNSGPEYDNQWLSEDHFARAASDAPIREI